MKVKFIEASNNGRKLNWGRFAVLQWEEAEWARASAYYPEPPDPRVAAAMEQAGMEPGRLLGGHLGWGREHRWVLDLATGEGACFRVQKDGCPPADLEKHRVWVCPLFEPFLGWLYQQDVSDVMTLPDTVELPDAPFAMAGYRREGAPQ